MSVVSTPVCEALRKSVRQRDSQEEIHYNASSLSDRFPQRLTNEVLTLGFGMQAAGEITQPCYASEETSEALAPVFF